jgi:hypothetical protein
MRNRLLLSCTMVYGQLNIDVPYVFTQGTKMIMQPGSSIFTDHPLTIEANSNLYACDQMWEGIHIYIGGLLKMNNSLIEDANNAIWVHTAGAIHLRNNRFHSNIMGLRFEETATTVPLVATILALDNNQFDCTGTTLLPPNAANTLSLTGISNLRYNLLISNPNRFRDMRNGIIFVPTGLLD